MISLRPGDWPTPTVRATLPIPISFRCRQREAAGSQPTWISRALLMNPGKAMGIGATGRTGFRDARSLTAMRRNCRRRRTCPIVDPAGNAVALTSSIEAAFLAAESRWRAFLLNNQLTDFSLTCAKAQGKPVANRAEAGQAAAIVDVAHAGIRCRREASMLCLDLPVAVASSTMWRAPCWLCLTAAWKWRRLSAARPRRQSQWSDTEVERRRVDIGTRELERRGHEVRELDMTSGLHVIVRRNGIWTVPLIRGAKDKPGAVDQAVRRRKSRSRKPSSQRVAK
jgi:hypothetical protein